MTNPDGNSALWRIPAVRSYLTSNALATTGISLMLTVLFKQAFDITGDALSIGIIGLLQFIPAVLLVVVSGYVADRFDRRRVTAAMTVGRVGCALAFFFYSRGLSGELSGELTDGLTDDLTDDVGSTVWPLYAITLLFGAFDAIAIPARHAMTPLVVDRELLPNLVAATAVTRVLSAIVGPVTAGLLYQQGADAAYLVVAVLFTLSIPPILRTQFAVAQARISDRPSVKLALQGLRFIRRSPIVLSAISLDMFAVLFGGAVALIPVIAEERLGVGNVAYGWLRASPGIGAGAMGLLLTVRPVTRRVGPTLLAIVATFGAFHITLGLTTNYAVAFISLVIAGGADMVSMAIRSTLVPLATPEDQLGRVSAVESVFIGASNELGAFESGVAARWFGVPWSIAGGGIITVAIAVGFAAFVPSLRRIDRYDEVRPGT